MNPNRVATRGLATRGHERGLLTDFELCFDKVSGRNQRFGHAHIRYARGGIVEGVLYRLAEPNEILKMDPFEKAPWNYGRDVVPIATDQGIEWAWTYFANPAVLIAGLKPEQSYLDHLLAGRDLLSPAYLRSLETWGA